MEEHAIQSAQKPASGLRDDMAVYRTKMANQRTFLAHLAMSLHFFAFGLTAAEINEFENFRWTVIPLVVIGSGLLVFGIWNFFRMSRKIEKENRQWNSR